MQLADTLKCWRTFLIPILHAKKVYILGVYIVCCSTEYIL